MKVSRMPRGMWAATGLLTLAAAVGVPPERAVAAGAGLEVASDTDVYTLKAEPYTDEGNAPNTVTLTNTGTTRIRSYTLTVDYSSLVGVADVTVPFPGCRKKTEGVLVCHGDNAPRPGETTRLGDFGARSLRGARGGTAGEIRVSGQADGTAITERVWKVDIKDVGFAQDRLTGAVKGKVDPGAEVRPAVGFTYFGAKTIKGTDFSMYASRGSFGREFSNCKYGKLPLHKDGDPLLKLTGVTGRAAVCHFDDTIEVGDSFDVSPGPLRIDDDAFTTEWRSRLGGTDQLKEMTDVHPGKGPELKLVPRPDDAPPGKPSLNYTSLFYEVNNLKDDDAFGASAEGRPGDVVTVRVGYRNNGPAASPTWTGDELGEDPVETRVAIPRGTTVVKAPDRCWADTHNGDGKGKPGGRKYSCTGEMNHPWVSPGERFVWSFGLRIDKTSALKLRKGWLVVDASENDRFPANNSAAITVKVLDETSTGARAAPWIAGTAGVLAAGVGTALFVRARRRRRS